MSTAFDEYMNEIQLEREFTADESYDHYVRHLSPYATFRPDELKAILCGNFSLEFPGWKKHAAKHAPARQSLKDVFESHPENHKTSQEPVYEEESVLAKDPAGDKEREVILRGEDVNDIPTRYAIKGLQIYEFPVIGVYVDRRICPGFKYRVRYLASSNPVFDDKARLLQSVGMGYGKRLTFRGDWMNQNDAYFWSDSQPNGFAFNIEAVSQGDKYIVVNDLLQPAGEVTVVSVDCPQVEESMSANNGTVRKTVRVRFTCTVTYYHLHHHGLVDLHHEDLEQVEGIAEVVKERGSSDAVVQSIQGLFLSRIGSCSFRKGM